MALIVEDGTGLDTAESYISVVDADTYHTNRGNSAWTSATEANREIALRLASEYIDQRFEFIGSKKTTAQALQWPREVGDFYEAAYLDPKIDVVPVAVEKAVSEYALRQLSADLMVDPETDESGRKLKSEVVDVGGAIKEGKTYVEHSSPDPFKPYPKADTYLRDLITGGAQQELARA